MKTGEGEGNGNNRRSMERDKGHIYRGGTTGLRGTREQRSKTPG